MSRENRGKLNHLLSHWPAHSVFACSWLHAQGYGFDLIAKYRKSGWLTSVGQGAVARAGDPVEWAGGLYAIQAQLKSPIHVGGKSALLLKGYGHFIPQGKGWVLSLFGPSQAKLPAWFKNYDWGVKVRLVTADLFQEDSGVGLSDHATGAFSILVSAPERAMLEFLSLVPQAESFEEAKLLMEGLTTLRPKMVQQLLTGCRGVKVKRLFLFLAEVCNHAWMKKLDLSGIHLGSGKRVIEKGGVLNKKYGITVPRSLLLTDLP
jgi:hypothetical protein